jgi:hypothetical protein
MADLDQMTIGVAHLVADFAATVDRRCQKRCSAGTPFLIDRPDVRDLDVEKSDVKGAGALNVLRDDEIGDLDPFLGCWKLCHPLVLPRYAA